MRRSGSPLPRGLTLTEVLIVIVLIAVLAGMLVPVLTMGRETSCGPACGHKLSQIMGACIAYTTTEETAWPGPWPDKQDPGLVHAADPHQARLMTVRMCAVLAAAQDLPNSLFACASCGIHGPATRPSPDPAAALIWGAGPEHAVSFAWDWAAPAEPGADRVVLAERAPYHHGAAYAAYGDSHTRILKKPVGASAGMATEGTDGKPVTGTLAAHPGAPSAEDPDDIYSPAGDGGDPLTLGKGSALRAWVK